MVDSKFKKPGTLVKFRGRRCVVQPSSDSDLIVLKPLGGSDSEIMAIFEEIHKNGNTVILVTHEPDIAEHAHRIVKMKDGEIYADVINENIISAADPNHRYTIKTV